MRINDIQTNTLVADYNSQTMPTYEDTTYTGGGSTVIEPEIIIPISNQGGNPVNSGNISVEQLETLTQQAGNTSQSGTSTSTITEPNVDSESSATTDETKTYVGGGITPDSNIVIDKPKRNYLMYGLIGLVGVYVVYKVFFNKKSE